MTSRSPAGRARRSRMPQKNPRASPAWPASWPKQTAQALAKAAAFKTNVKSSAHFLISKPDVQEDRHDQNHEHGEGREKDGQDQTALELEVHDEGRDQGGLDERDQDAER